MEVCGQLNLGKEPQYTLNRRLGGPHSRSGRLWRRTNFSPRPGYEPRNVQPAASRYTDSNDNKAKNCENPTGEIFMFY
jgi:hypothetical protein